MGSMWESGHSDQLGDTAEGYANSAYGRQRDHGRDWWSSAEKDRAQASEESAKKMSQDLETIMGSPHGLTETQLKDNRTLYQLVHGVVGALAHLESLTRYQRDLTSLENKARSTIPSPDEERQTELFKDLVVKYEGYLTEDRRKISEEIQRISHEAGQSE